MSKSIYSINYQISVNQDITASNNGIYLPQPSGGYDFVLTFDTRSLIDNKDTNDFGEAEPDYMNTVLELDSAGPKVIASTFFNSSVAYDADNGDAPLTIKFDTSNVVHLFANANVVLATSTSSGSQQYSSQLSSMSKTNKSLSMRLLEIVAIKIFGDARYAGGVDNYPDFFSVDDQISDDTQSSIINQIAEGINDALQNVEVVQFLQDKMNLTGAGDQDSELMVSLLQNSSWQFPIQLSGSVEFDETDDTEFVDSIPVPTWGAKLVADDTDPNGLTFDFSIPIQLVLETGEVPGSLTSKFYGGYEFIYDPKAGTLTYSADSEVSFTFDGTTVTYEDGTEILSEEIISFDVADTGLFVVKQ